MKKYNLLLFLFLHSLYFFSQYQVKNFFSLTGKKDVPVNTIAQDHSGFLLLGTSEGLYKFDGRSAEEVLKENRLLKREISAVFVDVTDKIWIGTKDGKVYSIFSNKIDSVPLPPQNKSKITSFCALPGKLIISTYGNGVFVWGNGILSHCTSELGLSDDILYKAISDNDKLVWCASDAGISELNFSSDKPTIRIIDDSDGLPDNIVRDLSLSQNKLFISMQDSGVCAYNLGSLKFEKNPFFSNWTLGTVLNSISESSGKLIIATETNGIILFKNSILTIYDYPTTIQSPAIQHMFIDREKQIWLAGKKGISQFSEKRYHFIDKNDGLENDKILALAIDNDQSIWIGTSTGVSKLMKDEKGKIQVKKIEDLKKYTISCAVKAPDGNIWFGTYGQGIIVLSTETGKSVIINTGDDKIADNNISHIYFEDAHTVYISTLGGGLIKASVDLDGEYKYFKIERTYTESDGLGSNYVYSCITGNQSQLFAATDGGGLQVLEKNKFVDLTRKFNFASNTIFSLCKDKFNHIWAISNEDGVICYDGKSLIRFNQKKGLRDEQPQQLICSGDYIYTIHSKGIDKINCKDHHISYFDISNEDLEPNLNAILYYKDKLYSGTNSGLLVLRTSIEAVDSIKPKIYFKNFELNFKIFPMDSIYEFRYNQNNFGFTFDGIWLKNPVKLNYRYRLEGLESSWNYSNEGEQVNYNNLGSGNYTFIAQVQNEEEVWSEPIAYSFTILTPLWKRWWFWLSVVSALSFGVYAFLRYRLKALQKENMILEVKVRERTVQIENQSRIIEAKNVELEQLSLVASKTENVVLILDPNGNLEYVNESFIRLHNLNMNELIAKHGKSIYQLSNHPKIKEIISNAITQKKSVSYETLNKKVETGSSSELWQSSTLTPIFDNHNQLKKIVIIDTDVSERKKQEQIIVQKNKDITDSISYAQKIQYSILPHTELIKTYLPDSFVVYLTKDIVSGDFYWFSHINGSSILAAVDCTGHGVPGAFMSLIGYNLLNRIVNEQKITDPKEILLALNNGVIEALYKNETESKDGMDIAICKINHHQNTLEYAGAMRPLWYTDNNQLIEIKADKIPIGTKQKDREQQITYTTHLLALNGDRHFYIFTDGYADQFGGPKEKKYSTGKFKELLLTCRQRAMDKQAHTITSEHITWKGKNEQVDDILVIGFKL